MTQDASVAEAPTTAAPSDNGLDPIDAQIAISNENARIEGDLAEDWRRNALSIVVVGASGKSFCLAILGKALRSACQAHWVMCLQLSMSSCMVMMMSCVIIRKC